MVKKRPDAQQIQQIAALLLPGATVVIFPLSALQRDQVEVIEEQEVAEADVVNSAVPVAQRQEAFENLKRKKLEVLFLAPEQFNNEEVLARLKAVEILPTGEVDSSEALVDHQAAAAAATRAQERRQQFVRSRLEMMRGYAEVRNFRRQYLLNYFGEPRQPSAQGDSVAVRRSEVLALP